MPTHDGPQKVKNIFKKYYTNGKTLEVTNKSVDKVKKKSEKINSLTPDVINACLDGCLEQSAWKNKLYIRSPVVTMRMYYIYFYTEEFELI